jgi:hypothetical protein
VKHGVQADCRKWMSKLVEKAEKAAVEGNMKEIYLVT